jgi:hypothetical protein
MLRQRERFQLVQQVALPLPQDNDFGIVLSAKLLKPIDFPLNRGEVAFATHALDGAHAFCGRCRGSRGRGDTGDELGLHWI